jgi:hypothetical protein
VSSVAYGQNVVKAVTTIVVYATVPFPAARAPVAAARSARPYFMLNYEIKKINECGKLRWLNSATERATSCNVKLIGENGKERELERRNGHLKGNEINSGPDH